MTNKEVLDQIREIPHLGSRNLSNGVYTYSPKSLALIQSFREGIERETVEKCQNELDLLATSVLSYGIDEIDSVAYRALKNAGMILDQLKTKEAGK